MNWSLSVSYVVAVVTVSRHAFRQAATSLRRGIRRRRNWLHFTKAICLFGVIMKLERPSSFLHPQLQRSQKRQQVLYRLRVKAKMLQIVFHCEQFSLGITGVQYSISCLFSNDGIASARTAEGPFGIAPVTPLSLQRLNCGNLAQRGRRFFLAAICGFCCLSLWLMSIVVHFMPNTTSSACSGRGSAEKYMLATCLVWLQLLLSSHNCQCGRTEFARGSDQCIVFCIYIIMQLAALG